ncbi:MAG: thiamine-phosphate diphosphorylase [Candidatus Handelsmanbacteria bacterium RIFCSPLOWO2_12_FULL_64_10]|uniref:Thiamine-phosphate synthase n=1 Tax=Handelsmanbacteria sp. (strain RIFCSPLOWO2_12_FULL_64_10) TaxID=1817868 RepID=A0A1F6CUI9_HANXR|nr:MAG: thiamine-phosphate diphosphorylase [Candidatus Handelsmanbacteria bacterium RIFCSPLOWO2_12_FULL_64_10]
MKRLVKGLYVIVDPEAARGRDLVGVTAAAVRGGADAVQLRAKGMGGRALYETACALREVCRAGGAVFIVNDRADVAAAADADGVHVGQEDLPVAQVRRAVGPGRIVGASAKTVDLAVQAVREGADYLGVGAMFASPTKPGSSVIGPEGLREIRAAVRATIVGIGGVDAGNAGLVMRAGADGVAVISAVVGAEDVEAAARRIKEAIRGMA